MDKCDRHDFGGQNTAGAAPQAADSRACAAEPLMNHQQEQLLEEDAWRRLTHAVAMFRMSPSTKNFQEANDFMVGYHDAWVRGRRRIMD